MIHHKPKVIDLCCGAGGFSEGFHQAGFDIILGVDIWGDALESFKRNYNCDIIETDIKLLNEIPDADVVIGSPPCQSFSRMKNGRCNPDTSIIDHVLSLVQDRPYVFENVWQSRHFFKTGNKARFYAQRFGVPQIRERLFVSSLSFQLFPEIHRTMESVLKGKILTTQSNTSGRGKRLPDGRRYKLMNEMCWTIDTGGSSLKLDDRLLTIDEYKMLMGFPLNYELFGGKMKQIKQLGNAVCPPVSKAIAEGILSDIS